VNTESAVISAVCNNKDMSTLLLSNVDEFFQSHKDVWDGLKSYYYKFKSVPDVEVLTERFKDFEPEQVKGETEYYLDKLREEYIASKMRALLLKHGTNLKSNSSLKVLTDMQADLSSISKLSNVARDLDLTDYEDAEKHLNAVRDRSKAMGGTPGIPTGFKAMDLAYPTGMAPGHLIVAIGWPGKGKTWFTAYLACKAWEHGFKPMIVSLEMSPENMRDRIYTMMGSGLFRASDFSRGNINTDDFHNWATKKFSDKRGFIVVSNEGSGDVTPSTVQAKIDQHKPDIVICDYHQLFTDTRKSNNIVERNRNISSEFKQLAIRNGIPVIDITAATMDDISDQDNPPMLSQVAWSKAIEYDADMAFAVHKTPDTNIIEIVSRKNRHGTDFGFYLDWDIDRGIIKEIYDNPF
jgi:replicative DNA helicase